MKKILIGVLLGLAVLFSAGVQAQTPDSYDSLMRSGNAKFAAKDYISAKTYYEMALKQKPKDTEAKKKLDQTLVKIQEESEQQELFYLHLDAGDALYGQSKYEEALVEYNKALAIFPNDNYVGTQVNSIQGILKERKDKQDAYNTAIAQGNTLLNEENFDAAIMQFEIAKEIFPNDNLPKERIAEAKRLQSLYNEKVNRFNGLMEEANSLALRKNFDAAIVKLNQALEIFPNDTQAKEKLLAIQGSKDLNDRYNSVIAEADKLYEEKKYQEARAKYQSVEAIVPNDPYATDMIRRINELFESPAYIAEQNYLAAMAKGEALLGQEQYQMALNTYQEALTFKPGDPAATQKVNEISATLQRQKEEAAAAQLALERAAAAEAARQTQIKEMLDVANGLLAEEQYQAAKAKYQEVLGIDADNAKATAKIKEIDDTLARIAADSQQRFDNAMSAAQRYLNDEDYTNAIAQYQIALVAKPENTDATTGLAQAQRLENERIANLRAQYEKYVKEGDKQYAAKALDKAVENYLKAEELGLGESYPTEMIAKINKIIEDNKLYELNTDAFTMTANTPRRFSFNPVDVASRRSNYIILRARNLTPGKSFPMIVSFGSDSGKNGGFVLAISESGDEKTYIFRIGSQYKWFSENNTWIELISEHDDVEVSLVEISRSN